MPDPTCGRDLLDPSARVAPPPPGRDPVRTRLRRVLFAPSRPRIVRAGSRADRRPQNLQAGCGTRHCHGPLVFVAASADRSSEWRDAAVFAADPHATGAPGWDSRADSRFDRRWHIDRTRFGRGGQAPAARRSHARHHQRPGSRPAGQAGGQCQSDCRESCAATRMVTQPAQPHRNPGLRRRTTKGAIGLRPAPRGLAGMTC